MIPPNSSYQHLKTIESNARGESIHQVFTFICQTNLHTYAVYLAQSEHPYNYNFIYMR